MEAPKRGVEQTPATKQNGQQQASEIRVMHFVRKLLAHCPPIHAYFHLLFSPGVSLQPQGWAERLILTIGWYVVRLYEKLKLKQTTKNPRNFVHF